LRQWRGLGLSENESDYFFSFFHIFFFKLFGIFVFVSERKPPLGASGETLAVIPPQNQEFNQFINLETKNSNYLKVYNTN